MRATATPGFSGSPCSDILCAMNRRDLLGMTLAAAARSGRGQSSPRFTKGICSIIFPKEMPRAECFAQAKSAGFDAMEVAVGTDFSLDITRDEARRLADAAGKADRKSVV